MMGFLVLYTMSVVYEKSDGNNNTFETKFIKRIIRVSCLHTKGLQILCLYWKLFFSLMCFNTGGWMHDWHKLVTYIFLAIIDDGTTSITDFILVSLLCRAMHNDACFRRHFNSIGNHLEKVIIKWKDLKYDPNLLAPYPRFIVHPSPL